MGAYQVERKGAGVGGETDRQTETDRERQRDRQRETETDRQRQRILRHLVISSILFFEHYIRYQQHLVLNTKSHPSASFPSLAYPRSMSVSDLLQH